MSNAGSVTLRLFGIWFTIPSSILPVVFLSTIASFLLSRKLLPWTLTSQFRQLSSMPSKPTIRKSASSSSSRQVASSPTLTSSTSSSSTTIMSKNESSQQSQKNTSNFNPSAIESWMNGVSNNSNNNHTVSRTSSSASMQMEDPAVQAYMAAKMGLFQQSSTLTGTHSHHTARRSK